MTRKTWNPLGAIRTQSGRALRGAVRVLAYVACVLTVAGAVTVRAAWGAVSEKTMSVGRDLAALNDVLGTTKTLLLNGQEVHVSTAVLHVGVNEALDRFQAVCDEHPSGLSRALDEATEAGTPEGKKPKADKRKHLDVLRTTDDDQGFVLCLVDRKNASWSTSQRMEEFVKTHDVSVFGDSLYAFARKTPDGSTHVITTWTSGRFMAFDLFPATGDAPGNDSALTPRPIGARRILSAVASGAPYGIRVYESTESMDHVFDAFDADMAARGWTRGKAASIHNDGRVFLNANGVLIEAFARTWEGKTIFSSVEMGQTAPQAITTP